MLQADQLPSELLKDLERNREGRLSTRQRIALITEPLASLLLLSLPLLLLAGRYGAAGRLVALALIAGFALTMGLRALRFARVRLCYRVLFAEGMKARWMFWRKTTLTGKTGEAIRFDHRLSSRRLRLKPEQSLHVYYIEAGERRILLTMIPRDHPQAGLAAPGAGFIGAGGAVYAD